MTSTERDSDDLHSSDPLAPDAEAADSGEREETAASTEKKTAARARKPATPKKRAALVYNPIKVDLELLKASLASAEKAAGWAKTLLLETSEEDPGGGMAREALDKKVDVVIAAGGDGTVRAVAEALRGSDTAIALLPSGTGNLLARNLNLTLDDVDESIATAFTGEDRPIDLGVATLERADRSKEKFAFVVMAGLGLDAQMIANTNPELKKKVGWVAYVDAIAKSMRGKNRLELRYNLDGAGNRHVNVHTIMIGNCGSLPGNVLLLPDASVDDGEFDIVALRPEGFFGWLSVGVKIIWENGVLRRTKAGQKVLGLTKEIKTVRYLKGKELVVRLKHAEPFELDGDGFGEIIALKTVVDPKSLIVKVPAEV